MDLIDIIDINEIRVFDPNDPNLEQKARLDHEGYKQMLESDFSKAIEKYGDLRQKVLASPVENGNLQDYLYGPDGYFARHPTISEVLFINGKFLESRTGKEGFDSKIKRELADKHNGIPFVFKRHDQSPGQETKN